MIGFIIGLIAGTVFGVIIAVILFIGSAADDRMNDGLKNQKEKINYEKEDMQD